ncbi:hypothetical protein [Actinokineospora bangkokensis]|uniref:WXG100 family type VII secretion target n=1 Tax=Actinokineospora bangkokensis TaxID=1193682 RepID=A0A1Q9LMX9_9PSEU|nr:hypothetical protein [Actinokineospora bangkokensis]OLR93344.1 hypothetical protein BJP25_17895 [Actinokineospora bangkokensis]
MTSFDINNNGYLDVNEQLAMHVKTVGQILQDLNGVLKHTAEAIDSKATPLWLEQQTQWNQAYQDMMTQINLGTMSSINVHEIFQNGDNLGAKIMYS